MLRDYISGLLVLVVTSSVSAADPAVTLTGKTLISGDHVTVGDIFDNTGSVASHILAPAPQVGSKLILTSADLERITEAFHLNWAQADDDVAVSLERDAFAVDQAAIADALAKSDLNDKIASDANFQVNSLEAPIILDGQAVPALTITETSFDPATERFAATLNISRNGNLLKQVKISGLATPMITIPVLANPAASNIIISKADIIELAIPKKSVRPGTILSADELAGMTPKRALKPNQAITLADVTPPLMVKRNELVTVTYRNGPIILSTKARAMANAVRGDTVMLLNVNSKKPFEAKITGPQQAEVLINALNG